MLATLKRIQGHIIMIRLDKHLSVTFLWCRWVPNRQFKGKLKQHVAIKKVPYVDSQGTQVQPTKPNGIKMEKFVFDVFPFSRYRWWLFRRSFTSTAHETHCRVNSCNIYSLTVSWRNFVAFEVVREDEFSPLKNADGAATDTPTVARNSLLAQHCRWATAAGAKLLDQHGNPLPSRARWERNPAVTCSTDWSPAGPAFILTDKIAAPVSSVQMCFVHPDVLCSPC